ncbi:sulfite exporter TauE/SafE family protein [Vibrio mangrovi]|uniref:Probable membrane transporter protein n=1 Tax=Vibrio mangrovi TaxID=474394 RepID=A0A1Y6IR39_9VIBR|nr:sulfite exporter TauE/SafE family protein [Vibrio mangrovi]MDW6001885.1 sulfite exporter TauE/SafE family protein [Vibrio mangrovi]SMS00088.1 Sulfite exporter TauE/SafE [Vibrio mangrovi]
MLFKRKNTYVFFLALFYCVWSIQFSYGYTWQDLWDHWMTSATMVVGSLVAGSTPLGGGAVAFPVLTKVLHYSSQDARDFSILIQSVGMTFATLFFIARNVSIDWKVIIFLLPFTVIGQFLGYFISVDESSVKVIFSIFLILFSLIFLSHKKFIIQNALYFHIGLMPVGIICGALCAFIGCGSDTLLFFYLILFSKRQTLETIPTSVCFMAINSLLSICVQSMLSGGSSVHINVYDAWFFAAPIVAVGAPLGGRILTQINPYFLYLLIYVLIAVEVISTIILVDFEFLYKSAMFVVMSYSILKFMQYAINRPVLIEESQS